MQSFLQNCSIYFSRNFFEVTILHNQNRRHINQISVMCGGLSCEDDPLNRQIPSGSITECMHTELNGIWNSHTRFLDAESGQRSHFRSPFVAQARRYGRCYALPISTRYSPESSRARNGLLAALRSANSRCVFTAGLILRSRSPSTGARAE